MEVSIQYAKANLLKLMRQAEAGAEIIITRVDKPVIRLTPVRPPQPRFDTLKGKVGFIDPFLLFAMSNEEAEEFIG